MFVLGTYASTGTLLTSGMGAISTIVFKDYPGQEARATDLLTYPTLFMGIGNLVSMPLALTIGRRPVFLFSLLLLVLSGVWCVFSKDLGSHIAGRDIMSLAAGSSEALCPLMIQDIFFLHERGRMFSWFSTTLTVGSASFLVATTFMVASWGWRWWYGLFTILNGVILVLSILFVCETEFDRPKDASEGAVHLDFNKNGDLEVGGEVHRVVRVTTAQGNVLDPEKYGERTWRHDLALFSIKPKWGQVPMFYKHVAQGLCMPSIIWLLILNGAFLGLYVFQASTFAPVLIMPPNSWKFENVGFVQLGQIVVCFFFVPLLGYGTDMVIKWMSRWKGGVYQPEYRIIVLAFPAVVGVVCAVIYGQAAAHPERWNWSAIAVSYNGIYLSFLGANIVGVTYAIDSFPLRAGSLLVLICAGRGIISFGLSYATLPSIQAIGYDGAMNVQAVVCGVLALIGVPMYFFGSYLRQLAQKWFAVADEKE